MNKPSYELDENEKLDVVRGEGKVAVSREDARETGFFMSVVQQLNFQLIQRAPVIQKIDSAVLQLKPY